mmetsp:Transcript_15539/g.30513  ORF Transcript_15539/g.30513 Transcript_15539/m.30513 type:complete len:199 (+) Transcript_15539:496-1092(+)
MKESAKEEAFAILCTLDTFLATCENLSGSSQERTANQGDAVALDPGIETEAKTATGTVEGDQGQGPDLVERKRTWHEAAVQKGEPKLLNGTKRAKHPRLQPMHLRRMGNQLRMLNLPQRHLLLLQSLRQKLPLQTNNRHLPNEITPEICDSTACHFPSKQGFERLCDLCLDFVRTLEQRNTWQAFRPGSLPIGTPKTD